MALFPEKKSARFLSNERIYIYIFYNFNIVCKFYRSSAVDI